MVLTSDPILKQNALENQALRFQKRGEYTQFHLDYGIASNAYFTVVGNLHAHHPQFVDA